MIHNKKVAISVLMNDINSTKPVYVTYFNRFLMDAIGVE